MSTNVKNKFPSGYIDSPFITPDGSALYFLHSAASTFDMLTANPNAQPQTDHLSGHTSPKGGFWWNTDLYVSQRNPDGSWQEPQNLGPSINTQHLEHGPWVNRDQTILIFSRENVLDPSLSHTFISKRQDKSQPWGDATPMAGEIGDYGLNSFTDFHMSSMGTLFFWGEKEGHGDLWTVESLDDLVWDKPAPMPSWLQSELDDTQPWTNDQETILFFNRRGQDGNTLLLKSERMDSNSPWSCPETINLEGFSDASGFSVWGEPSFTEDGTLFFVRFDTSVTGWCAELMSAPLRKGGGYGPPKPIHFSHP